MLARAIAFILGRRPLYALRPRSRIAKIDGSETIDLNGSRERPLNREGVRSTICRLFRGRCGSRGMTSAADYRLENLPVKMYRSDKLIVELYRVSEFNLGEERKD